MKREEFKNAQEFADFSQLIVLARKRRAAVLTNTVTWEVTKFDRKAPPAQAVDRCSGGCCDAAV
jgi:hypothetical protein